MAGIWIPMRTDLSDCPKVLRMAEILKCDPDLVVGRLLRLWSWAGDHTTSGYLPGVTTAMIDARVRHAGLCDALCEVLWAKRDETGAVSLLRWAKYNSKSSRKRMLDARRAALYRSRGPSRSVVTTPLPRAEQSRAEKSIAFAQAAEAPALPALLGLGIAQPTAGRLADAGVTGARAGEVIAQCQGDPNARSPLKAAIGILKAEFGITNKPKSNGRLSGFARKLDQARENRA